MAGVQEKVWSLDSDLLELPGEIVRKTDNFLWHSDLFEAPNRRVVRMVVGFINNLPEKWKLVGELLVTFGGAKVTTGSFNCRRSSLVPAFLLMKC